MFSINYTSLKLGKKEVVYTTYYSLAVQVLITISSKILETEAR